MTLNGAIAELVMLHEHSMMPDVFKPSIQKIIETISECEEPSAQPEIIRCKDCKFTDGEKPIADGRYWCVLHGSFMYFCSDADMKDQEGKA